MTEQEVQAYKEFLEARNDLNKSRVNAFLTLLVETRWMCLVIALFLLILPFFGVILALIGVEVLCVGLACIVAVFIFILVKIFGTSFSRYQQTNHLIDSLHFIIDENFKNIQIRYYPRQGKSNQSSSPQGEPTDGNNLASIVPPPLPTESASSSPVKTNLDPEAPPVLDEELIDAFGAQREAEKQFNLAATQNGFTVEIFHRAATAVNAKLGTPCDSLLATQTASDVVKVWPEFYGEALVAGRQNPAAARECAKEIRDAISAFNALPKDPQFNP